MIHHEFMTLPKSDKSKVYEVYNKIGDWFLKMRAQDLKMEEHHLKEFTSHLKKGAKILDLGCGTGKPIAEYLLTQGYEVTGVDGSEKMLALAKTNIPKAKLIHQDMRKIDLKEKFDAIIMWHSSFHLPANDQIKLFPILKEHLNPKGLLMFTSGLTNGEVWSENGGENLYHASLATNEYREILKQNNFEVLNYSEEDKKAGGATVWLTRQTQPPTAKI
jgi:SAM-dependent methyltransferase